MSAKAVAFLAEDGSPVARILMAAVVVVAALAQTVVRAEEPSQAALNFAGTFSDDQLSGMLSRIGGRSGPMVALSQLNGQLVAEVFDLEINEAVAKYGDQWRRNMALAWEPLLSDDEMISLVVEGADSAHSEKYLGLRSDAGQAMQASSADLFRSILEEVIRNTQARLSAEAGDGT